jgi:hypothetical protein
LQRENILIKKAAFQTAFFITKLLVECYKLAVVFAFDLQHEPPLQQAEPPPSQQSFLSVVTVCLLLRSWLASSTGTPAKPALLTVCFFIGQASAFPQQELPILHAASLQQSTSEQHEAAAFTTEFVAS